MSWARMTSATWSKPKPGASLAYAPLTGRRAINQPLVSEPDPVLTARGRRVTGLGGQEQGLTVHVAAYRRQRARWRGILGGVSTCRHVRAVLVDEVLRAVLGVTSGGSVLDENSGSFFGGNQHSGDTKRYLSAP